MNSSLIAIDRTVEMKIKEGEISIQEVRKNGKILLSDFRGFTDDQVIERLKNIGADIVKSTMESEIGAFYRAEDYSRWYRNKYRICKQKIGEDILWLGLTVLWERWFPKKANFEMLDEKIYEGYLYREKKELEKTSDLWRSAWGDIKFFMKEMGYRDIKEFDENFRGSYSIENWAVDFLEQGYNSGILDKKYFQQRVDFCIEFINRNKNMGRSNMENFKRAIAESLFALGNKKEGESFFNKYLKEDPKWGWGWIGWADCYWLMSEAGCSIDYQKAEEILLKGCKLDDTRNIHDVKERLVSLYYEMGENEKAQKLEDEMLIESMKKIRK